MNTALYDSIRTDVIVNTNRPHQIAETDKAIRDATLELHSKDFFDLDVETVVLRATSPPANSLEFTTPAGVLIRKIKDITPILPNGQLGAPLLNKAIGSRFNDLSVLGYGGWYSNIGKKLVISVASPTNAFQLSYYSMPSVASEVYKSWIAQTYPYMVTDLATAKLFHQNGMEAEARMYFARVGSQEIRDSHVHILISEHSDRN
jgi:hypothetical protein